MGPCARPCVACVGCHAVRSPDAESLHARAGDGSLDLGGGDVTKWPSLWRFLELSTERPAREVWVEAPAGAFDESMLARLRSAGCRGVVIQLDSASQEPVAREALALGLGVRVRLVALPETLAELGALAERLRPMPAMLELAALPDSFDGVERLLIDAPNVAFSAARLERSGYLPPCLLPAVWQRRPSAFRHTLRAADGEPNDASTACARCALGRRCRWNASPTALAAAEPPASTADLFPRPRPARSEPEPERPVHCTTPWTTLEIAMPDGMARQCCTTWTVGARGDAVRDGLLGVWNGAGYQDARRRMGKLEGDGLCASVCPRLYDRRFDERHFGIEPGGERFVQNQRRIADDIRERREVATGKPLHLGLCPSTYCNYDCVMCVHGRTPRRDLPDSIFDEVPELLPFLSTLTLLGGEPFAHPRTWELLERADLERHPDLRVDVVTNGSLLTPAALERLDGCALGHVTVSLNAGSPETYERIQRGISLDSVLENLDALLELRARQRRWFGVSLSFVVQRDNADDLLGFARLADQRNLDIRLLPLSPEGIPEIDFLENPDEVARVVERLDQLSEHARRTRPAWLDEIRAVREATLAAHRRGLVTL
jgi:MoaA/NifB/PqqE/SkfB family radical SAM enzyme